MSFTRRDLLLGFGAAAAAGTLRAQPGSSGAQASASETVSASMAEFPRKADFAIPDGYR